MKVNSVLWLYALSVVFLCFEFGSSSTTSVGRPPTSSTAATIAVKPKSNRKPSKITSARGRGVTSSNGSIIKINNTTESIGRSSNSRGSSRTSVSRPTSLSLFNTANGREKKAVRQLEIPTNRKKNTTPKKYTTEGKFSVLQSTAGPTRVDFPKPTFSLPEKRSTKIPKKQQLICPKENEVKFDLFPRKCERNKDCNSRTSNELCCSIFGAKSCVSGLPRPLEESTHSPIFGIIPRHCPQRPLAELWWEVKTCETDMDCWPRVCCPDGQMRYCRSSKPELDIVPVPVKRSINYLSEYLECTPAPPPIFDLHPKPCNSTIDCFPNICCQEAGKKHCRPPKKSVLTFMANFLNVGLVKRLTKNLVIK